MDDVKRIETLYDIIMEAAVQYNMSRMEVLWTLENIKKELLEITEDN